MCKQQLSTAQKLCPDWNKVALFFKNTSVLHKANQPQLGWRIIQRDSGLLRAFAPSLISHSASCGIQPIILKDPVIQHGHPDECIIMMMIIITIIMIAATHLVMHMVK